MNRLLPVSLTLLCAWPLAAADGIQYQLNMRAIRPGSTLEKLGFSGAAAGGGFAVLLGKEAMRARIRLDVDSFPGDGDRMAMNNYSLGMDGLLELAPDSVFHPTISAGAALQKWRLGSQGTFNGTTGLLKLAARAEFGIQYRQRFALYVGFLTGSIGWDRRVRCPYAGFSMNLL
ncbi:hypothetical protein [Mesoterricola silvestris]|uniref:Uncharacterized protein n=1 Tax=Mesoterricola silvestris TaxID=2927979 RepID=A0AA48GXV2_9BACT|nr:hypothetical protein [Mesoterricola silvestris]BDU73876.1 hypothetical protein METEAL_30500 [Mesoterricola silvestris]